MGQAQLLKSPCEPSTRSRLSNSQKHEVHSIVPCVKYHKGDGLPLRTELAWVYIIKSTEYSEFQAPFGSDFHLSPDFFVADLLLLRIRFTLPLYLASALSAGCHILTVTLKWLPLRQWMTPSFSISTLIPAPPSLVQACCQISLAKVPPTSQHDGYLWKGSWRSACLAPAWLSCFSGGGWSGSIGQTGSTESTPEISSPAFPGRWHSASSHRWPIQLLELQLLRREVLS